MAGKGAGGAGGGGRLPLYDDKVEVPFEPDHGCLDGLLDLLIAQKQAKALERETRPAKRAKRTAKEAQASALRQLRCANWQTKLKYTAPPSVQNNRVHKHTNCCGSNCTAPFEQAPIGLTRLRKKIQALKESARTEFINNRVRQKPQKEGVNSTRRSAGQEYFIENAEYLCSETHAVRTKLPADDDCVRLGCKASFMWLLGVHSDKIVQPTNPSPSFSTNSGNSMRHLLAKVSDRSEAAVAWLTSLATFYQHCPKSSLVFLPFAGREVVYEMYLAEMIEEYRLLSEDDFAEQIVGKCWFLQLWREREELSHIRLRRWLKFALCDACVSFRTRREDSGVVSKQLLVIIQQDEIKHVYFIKAERTSYQVRRGVPETVQGKPQVFSLILDAADQAEYGLPYHHSRSHSTQTKWRIKTHLMAGIAHGRQVYGFTFLDNCKHGNNITIECMWRIIEDTIAREGVLPPVFYLQLDNTSKQCKGQWLFGFLACLVQWGVFEKIVVSFLPVGHTHEDIDQIFSRLAMYLRHRNSRSRMEMLAGFQKCYTSKMGTTPVTDNVEAVANISDWLPPYLHTMDPQGDRKGISEFYQFQLYKVA